MVTVIVTVNTFGIGTAEIVTKRSLSGRTVTTTETETMTVARLLSTAIDQYMRDTGGLPSGRPPVSPRLEEGGTKSSLLGASSSVTDPAMIASSPCFQLTGAATLCAALKFRQRCALADEMIE
jgi:hypothetical protein